MTLHIKLHTFPMHLQSSSMYSDTLHIRLCMLHNSTPPPASAPLHVLPLLVCLFVCLPLSPVHVLLVCLFVSPSGLIPLIDGQCVKPCDGLCHMSHLSRLCDRF